MSAAHRDDEQPGRRRLEGKVAVVTGGAYGIGRAIARRLADEGARVAIFDIEVEAAEQAAAAIAGAIAVDVDVTDEDRVEAGVARVVEQLGGVDILVNNAGGATASPRWFWEVSREEWEFLLGLNLTSHWLCAKAVLPSMRTRGAGKIVNITTSGAFYGMAGMCGFSAAKAGVHVMTRVMAVELGDDRINVNTVAPGYVAFTRPKAAFDAAQVAEIEAEIPDLQALDRIGQPEDIAATVAFLASPEADQITGQLLSVDGGFRAAIAAGVPRQSNEQG